MGPVHFPVVLPPLPRQNADHATTPAPSTYKLDQITAPRTTVMLGKRMTF